MGSIINAIKIPVGSADIIFTGLIDSANYALAGLSSLVGGVLGSLGS